MTTDLHLAADEMREKGTADFLTEAQMASLFEVPNLSPPSLSPPELRGCFVPRLCGCFVRRLRAVVQLSVQHCAALCQMLLSSFFYDSISPRTQAKDADCLFVRTTGTRSDCNATCVVDCMRHFADPFLGGYLFYFPRVLAKQLWVSQLEPKKCSVV